MGQDKREAIVQNGRQPDGSACGMERSAASEVPKAANTSSGGKRTLSSIKPGSEEIQWTVKPELQQCNSDFTQTGNDLTDLLNSVNMPLLTLDRQLHIRRFTPQMQRLLGVRPTDMGRPISEIRLRLSIEDLDPILNDVLETLDTRELEVQDKEGRWHLLRVRPYRTSGNKIEGLVLLLLDIDQHRRSQQQLVHESNLSCSVLESLPVPVVVLNPDCSIRTANSAFRDLAQLETNDLAGRSLPDIMRLLWGINDMGAKLNDLLDSDPGALLEFEPESTTAHRKSLLIKAQVLSADGSRALLLTLEDTSRRRKAERLIAQEKCALESEIAIAARKLNRTQEELRGLTAHLFTVQEDERQRIARELHDDISQRLSLLQIALQSIDDDQCQGPALDKLNDARNQANTLNTDVRTMSHRLHPAILHDLGLPVALKSLVMEFGEREEMPATYASQNLPETIPPEASLALYRIAQEGLRNVAKHAGKTHVKVSLTHRNKHLQLKLMDFGLGFDRESESPGQGLGMISMQERARLAGGTFEVQSALGQGTTITVEVPLERHA